MTKEDPLLAFSCCLMRSELPLITDSSASTVRLWLDLFLRGNLTYPELLKLTTDECGKSSFVERLQQILSIPDDPLPEPEPDPILERRSPDRRNTRCWTTTEDNRLVAGVRKFGVESAWSAIAAFVGGGRTRSQCSQRWIRVLDPRISKSNWTPEEDKQLLELVLFYGEKSWMKVADHKGDRSDVQCRYRWTHLEREANKKKGIAKVRVEPDGVEGRPGHGQGVMPIFRRKPEKVEGGKQIELEMPEKFATEFDFKWSDQFFDSPTW